MLCIENKRARLCNTGASIDMPLIWNVCAPMMKSELTGLDK